jgi:AcrR family transcriptional regulator
MINPTRKQILHENTRDEIKSIAWKQIEQQSAAQLSLGSIAREMGLTTPALYRYFASRNDLVSALIEDAHISFAQALEKGLADLPLDDHAGRFRALCQDYHQWALSHPQPYSLLFGSPVPGYRLDNEAARAAERSFLILLGVVEAAHQAGKLAPQTESVSISILHREQQPGPPPAMVIHLALSAWSTIHGITSLELNGHNQIILAEHANEFAEIEITRLMQSIGFK